MYKPQKEEGKGRKKVIKAIQVLAQALWVQGTTGFPFIELGEIKSNICIFPVFTPSLLRNMENPLKDTHLRFQW